MSKQAVQEGPEVTVWRLSEECGGRRHAHCPGFTLADGESLPCNCGAPGCHCGDTQ